MASLPVVSSPKRKQNEEMSTNDVEKVKFQQDSKTFLAHVLDLFEENSRFNDTEIVCEDGKVAVPSLVLAAISPVFKETGNLTDLGADFPALIIPDISVQDVLKFIRHLFKFDEKPSDDDQSSLERVMAMLCVDFKYSDDLFEAPPLDSLNYLLDKNVGSITTEEPAPPPKLPNPEIKADDDQYVIIRRKRKPGRKPGQKKAEEGPYIKEEIIESKRKDTSYSLRTVRKKKKFADEVSDDDIDLSDEEDVPVDPLSPDDDESDYEPAAVKEEEEESEGTDESDLSDEEEDEEVDEDLSEDEIAFKTEAKQEKLTTMFTVKVGENGEVEVIDSEQAPKRKYRKRKRKEEIEDEEGEFKFRRVYAEEPVSNPRSLLKSSAPATAGHLVLFCSVCDTQCHSQTELKHHVAKEHPGSKLFKLAANNPHKDCAKCQVLMKSYEKIMADDDNITMSQICFPCPHCRRRYLGHLGGFQTHLLNDHKGSIATDLEDHDEEYFFALRRDDPNVLLCEFCGKDCPNTRVMNKHLSQCAANAASHETGLFCHICAKMFTTNSELRRHIIGHGKENINRQKNFSCRMCTVTCSTQDDLTKHIEKEHESNEDPDTNFVLHDGCNRCEALYNSYLEMKATGDVDPKNMAFKCPHCATVLYANEKHPPRYLYNHLAKFHTDPDTNDMTLGGMDPTDFAVKVKTDPDLLRCEFCGHESKSRNHHNDHLSICDASTIACKPGYMCDVCGTIFGTGKKLKDHWFAEHHDLEAFRCNLCPYVGRTEKYLKNHIRNTHSAVRDDARYLPCPKCGKLRKEGSSITNHAKRCGSGPKRITCNDCDQDFKREEDMRAHALIHYGQVTCPVHNIMFKHENEILAHVNVAADTDRFLKLQCCMCSRSFRHMCIYMKHLRRHLRISPYSCNVCDKQFLTFAALSVHQERQHMAPKQKNFQCEFCTKSFGTKGHLKEHIAGVHERYNNVNCPVCHKSFNTKKRMTKHLYATHKDMADQFRTFSKTEAFPNMTHVNV